MSRQTGGGQRPAEGPRSCGVTARQRLLDAVVAHFTAEGLADQSLRRIAEAIGSSHRMLLYHFGSKDGLLLAVVARGGGQDPGAPGRPRRGRARRDRALIRRMWAYLADPTLGDFERLFFALYGRALQGDEAIRSLLDDDVAHWLDANVALTAPWACPRTSPGPTPVSGSPSRAACCSTCSPRATAPGSKPPWRSSPRTTAAGGGSAQAGTGSSDRAS